MKDRINKNLLILTGLMLLLVNYHIQVEGFAGWVLISTLLFSIIPIITILLLKIKFNEIGLSTKSWEKFLPVSLLILLLSSPLIVYASTRDDFRSYYPIWNPGLHQLNFLVTESIILLLMFNNEFFFRGYLLFGLEARFGKWAIFLQSIPYSLLHIGKLPIEVPYSFLAGLVFGYLALKYRSIFPVLLIHWGGSVFLDILIIASKPA